MEELTIEATIDNIPFVTQFVDEKLEALDCPLKAQMQIDVAIDELFGNIAHYAYVPGTGDVTVRFEYDEPARTVSVTFIDQGIPFNPLTSEEPDVSLPVDERKIGGLGIFLVKKTMNAVEYRYENGSNILTIRKKM